VGYNARVLPGCILNSVVAVAFLSSLPGAGPRATCGAQGAYRNEEIPLYGIELPIPRKYDSLPAQPNESYVVRKWFGEPSRKVETRYDTRPQLFLVIIPKEEDQDDNRTDTSRTEGKVNSFPRFFGQQFPVKSKENPRGWTLGDRRIEKIRKDFPCSEYDSRLRLGPFTLKGRAYCLEDDSQIYAVYGFCPEEDFDKQAKMWRHIARKMVIEAEAAEAVDPKWERYYARRKKFKDPTFRAKLRSELPRGWKADDTENFIFVYSTKDEKLIRILKRELEAIRKAYLELFPPVEPIQAVSAVRVCRDLVEYHQYGGPRGSAGYWLAAAKELVFYDQGKGDGRQDSRIVLYHEAFHQYIHYSAGEVAPHSWFNEGYGDYFSGARFSRTGDIAKIGLNPWRVGAIKHFVERGDYVPFSEILHMEKPEFYKDGGRCYAQAWSMIYFLRESRDVQRHPLWRRILPRYFETLKQTFEEGLLALEAAKLADSSAPGPEDPGAMAEVTVRAREAAIAAALEGIDLFTLEELWVEFVTEMER